MHRGENRLTFCAHRSAPRRQTRRAQITGIRENRVNRRHSIYPGCVKADLVHSITDPNESLVSPVGAPGVLDLPGRQAARDHEVERLSPPSALAAVISLAVEEALLAGADR